MIRTINILLYNLLMCSVAFSQRFNMIPPDFFPKYKSARFSDILCTAKGSVLIASSMGLAEITGQQLELNTPNGYVTDGSGKKMFLGKESNIFKDLYESFTGIKLICEGPGNIVYMVSENNNLGCIDYNLGKTIMFPPFNFSIRNSPSKDITKIWMDKEGDLFIATNSDAVYVIADAAKLFKPGTGEKIIPTYQVGLDKDSNMVVTQGARLIKKINLGIGIIPYSFFEDPLEKRIILLGTNNGLYGYDKQTGQNINYLNAGTNSLTITNIETTSTSILWISTLEKGMGRFNMLTKSAIFYEYPKNNSAIKNMIYPIQTFSRKSANEFFVAIADSFPAVFNTGTGKYAFIEDSLFTKTENKTTDIKADASGNLYVIKGEGFYWSKNYIQNISSVAGIDSSFYGPFIVDIMLDGIRYDSKKRFYGRDESLRAINLKYDENNIQIYYSCRGVNLDSIVFAWKLDNYSSDWVMASYSILDDEINIAFFENLPPGKYIFHLKARNGNKMWLNKQAELEIVITPPFWQTWWFWAAVISGVGIILGFVLWWRIRAVKKSERKRFAHERQILELEAKALRAQMNPHFIFNCMNSIKSLIQQREDEKAVTYLTIFSKLIRTLFNNADKKEISLYDEMETCRLYLQLEAMRFDALFTYNIRVDESLDLKSVTVPALVVQPFIENAIWHGIVPKISGGHIDLIVQQTNNSIQIIIDDNGIGREASRRNRPASSLTHQSKGVNLTQTRLELDNLLKQRQAKLETIDKKKEDGTFAGTKVTIHFNEPLL